MEILKYPHPCLKRKCKDIARIDREAVDRVAEMFKTMYENRGVGLAASQVGWDARLFVLNITGEKADEMVFVNPVMVGGEGASDEEEGCLSVPGINANIRRWERACVRAFDLKGREFEVEGDGVLAIALQHEIDHLNGTLFISKLTSADKKAIEPKLKELVGKFKVSSSDTLV